MFLYLEDYLDLKNSLRWEALTAIEWESQNLKSKLVCNIQCPKCQGHNFSIMSEALFQQNSAMTSQHYFKLDLRSLGGSLKMIN